MLTVLTAYPPQDWVQKANVHRSQNYLRSSVVIAKQLKMVMTAICRLLKLVKGNRRHYQQNHRLAAPQLEVCIVNANYGLDFAGNPNLLFFLFCRD